MNIIADADETQFFVGLPAKLRESPGEHCVSERWVSFIDIIHRKEFRESLLTLGDYVLLLFLELQTEIGPFGTKDKLVETTHSNGSLEAYLFLFNGA